MTELYEVVKGVPLRPVIRSGGGTNRRKYPVEDMVAGDWFFVPRPSRLVGSYVSRITKGLPGKYSSRIDWAVRNRGGSWRQCERDHPGAIEGTGVWRIE